MNQPWPSIVGHFRGYKGEDEAVRAMLVLSEHIAGGRLAQGLFAWTSMFDLCIAQSPVEYPYSGPHLKVSPKGNGQVEFRYVDTPHTEKQWARTVSASEVVPRLRSFLSQLGWVAESLLQP